VNFKTTYLTDKGICRLCEICRRIKHEANQSIGHETDRSIKHQTSTSPTSRQRHPHHVNVTHITSTSPTSRQRHPHHVNQIRQRHLRRGSVDVRPARDVCPRVVRLWLKKPKLKPFFEKARQRPVNVILPQLVVQKRCQSLEVHRPAVEVAALKIDQAPPPPTHRP
jgi:hypothetical protein